MSNKEGPVTRTGELIAVYRGRLDPPVTQSQLADRVGVGLSTLNRWENCRRTGRYPPADDLDRILAALGVSWEEFGRDLCGSMAARVPYESVGGKQAAITDLEDALRRLFSQGPRSGAPSR